MAERPVQIAEHTFPHDRWSALALGVRMEALAERLGLEVDVWEEDGLGEAKGCFLQLGTGRVILLRELAHAIEHFGETGPTVFVDTADLALNGPEPIRNEVVEALGLAPDEVVRLAGVEHVADAAKFVANFASRKPGA